jgi:hypothetical protein
MYEAIPQIGKAKAKEVSYMDTQFAEDIAQNEPLFRKINREARSIPQSLYAGKWIALLRGRIVAIADTMEEAVQKLRKIEPDRFKVLVFEASGDYETVDYILEVA